MKKTLYIVLAALIASTAAVAAPQFGVAGYLTSGAAVSPGLYITDDNWSGALTVATESNDATGAKKQSTTTIGVNANYKMAMDSVTALTVGLAYTTTSGDRDGATIGTDNSFGLTAGVERELGNNMLFLADLNVYTSEKVEAVTTSKILNGGRVGFAYLF